MTKTLGVDDFSILKWTKAKTKHDLDLVFNRAPKGDIREYDGDLKVEGDLDLDALFSTCAAIIVKGKLIIDGTVKNVSSQQDRLLRVQGPLKAKNLIAGPARIELWGNANVANVVYSHSEKGKLKVLMKLRAEAIVRQFYNADFEDKHRGVFVDVPKHKDLSEFFVGEVMTGKKLDKTKMIERIQAGEGILR